MSKPDNKILINSPKGQVSIEIDVNSGFCFGVVNAIKLAEQELGTEGELLCLGNIVHNEQEVDRLYKKGLKAIGLDEFRQLSSTKVLFRAHGEPPANYIKASENKVEIIDATCPVVLKLQMRIKEAWKTIKQQKGQLVIYGKHGHAEVLGLVGQTNNQAIVVENEHDLSKIDISKPTVVFSQTTMAIDEYNELSSKLSLLIKNDVKVHDTICRQVANRAPKLREFVKKFDLVLFVSGTKSSNGKYLYSVSKSVNQNTHFISSTQDINSDVILNASKIGICGATSTPRWLMDKIALEIEHILQKTT